LSLRDQLPRGPFALGYEILDNARLRALKAYREDPLLRGTRSLSLREDGLAFTNAAVANLYRYTEITKIETREGFIMVFIGHCRSPHGAHARVRAPR
jgi:hypothetical protein